MKERLFKEGLISRKEHLEAQEALQLREKDREESQEEVRIVKSDRLVTLKSGEALAEKRLKEADRRLDLLLAGSRKEEIDAELIDSTAVESSKRSRFLLPTSVLLVAALIAGIIVALAQAQSHAVEMFLVPDTADMEVGGTVDFNVQVDPNGIGGIAGAGFAIKFDPKVLEVTKITHVATTLQLPIGAAIINTADGTAEFAAIPFVALT